MPLPYERIMLLGLGTALLAGNCHSDGVVARQAVMVQAGDVQHVRGAEFDSGAFHGGSFLIGVDSRAGPSCPFP